jgi:hypothetical protein
MLKTSIKACGLAVVGLFVAVGCSPASGEKPGEPELGTENFADIYEELAALDAALSKNPKDPAALAWAKRFDDRSDRANGLIHKVDMGGGRVIKFFEPGDGVRRFSEMAAAGTKPILPRGMNAESFVEVHRFLRPSEPIPTAIVEADARVEDQLLARGEERAHGSFDGESGEVGIEDERDTGPIQKHASSSCSHFEDDHGCYTGDFDVCFCNRTGGGSSYSNTANYSYHAFAAYRGAISIETTWMGQPAHAFQVMEGEWASVQQYVGPCFICPQQHAQRVFNAIDDGYHRHFCADKSGPADRCGGYP